MDRGVWLGAYVLMPDHLHCFVAIDSDRTALSGWMKSLKNALSKEFRNQGIHPPHWQKGFFDYVLRSDESSVEKWDYVRQNPVRAGFVKDVADWKFMGTTFSLEFLGDRS